MPQSKGLEETFEQKINKVFMEQSHSKHVKKFALGTPLVYYGSIKRFIVYEVGSGVSGIKNKKKLNDMETKRFDVLKKAQDLLDNFLGLSIPQEKPYVIFYNDLPKKKGLHAWGQQFNVKGSDEEVILLEKNLSEMGGNRLLGTVLHECGHIFWKRIDSKTKKVFGDWFDKTTKGADQKQLVGAGVIPTAYAFASVEECFCELFAFAGMFPDNISDETFNIFVSTTGLGE